jgi:hypothetical protein
VLGTLANPAPNDLPTKPSWDKLVVDHNLVPFLSKLLVPDFSQDDMVLEVVLFVGALALEPTQRAPLLATSRLLRPFHLLATSRLLRPFHALFQEKQHDNELTLQLLYVFYRLLRRREAFDEISR